MAAPQSGAQETVPGTIASLKGMWNHLAQNTTPTDYLIVGGMLALSLAMAAMVKLLWRVVLLPLSRRTRTNLDTVILERIEPVVVRLLPVIGFYFTYRYATELLLGVDVDAKPVPAPFRVVSGLFFILFVVFGAWGAYELLMSVLQWYLRDLTPKGSGRSVHTDFSPIIGRVLKVAILGIALIMVLSEFGVNVSGLLATAGIASLAVALAAQDTLANTIGGFALMADKSFRPGDRVQLADGKEGDVVDIGLRTTRILTYDDTLLIIPNSELAKSQIVNISYPTPRVKVRHRLGVAYGTDIEKVKRILLDIAQGNATVLKEPSPAVYFVNFGESSLDLVFAFWVDDYRDQHEVLDSINMEINRRFADEKIEIPFPQRDLHVRTIAGKIACEGKEEEA